VIANVTKRNEFATNLSKDYYYADCQKNEKGLVEEDDDNADNVYFPGLNLALINKRLAIALPGAAMFKIKTATMSCTVDPMNGVCDGGSSSSSSGNGTEDDTTTTTTTPLVHDVDFSTWYLVEGNNNKNFQDVLPSPPPPPPHSYHHHHTPDENTHHPPSPLLLLLPNCAKLFEGTRLPGLSPPQGCPPNYYYNNNNNNNNTPR
jgi:hypothetical protein